MIATEGSICRFTPAAELSLEVIEENIRRKVPNISMAQWLSTPEAAKLGYLLSRILNHASGTTEKRNTLFANSALEALYAVIRLSRQTAKESGRVGARQVLIHDRQLQYQRFFDPLSKGPEEALCPQVYFVQSEEEFRERLTADPQVWACTVRIDYPQERCSAGVLEAIESVSRTSGALSVVCCSEKPLSDGSLFRVPPNTHVVIFGENLTGNEVPFGAFCLAASAYAVWNTRRSLSSYTSTFAGNATALSAALKALSKKTRYINDVDRQVFAQIEGNFDERVRYFANFVHPIFVELFMAEKKELDIVQAHGSTLQLANGREVIDTSTLGCSLRGHNPEDVIGKVVKAYDSNTDYLERAVALIHETSAFSHVFPSVSGAGAVDNAITLSLLAQPGRKKVVCFTGNYAGKTLAAVNFSKTAPLLADFDLPAFEPYYAAVEYIDPFAADAEEKFLEQVGAGDVALVWFELVQGYMFKRLPNSVVELVEKNKERGGYLIGVDEVLTGLWKNGKTLLCQQEYMSKVDITTMSKATSDMVFPISWALATDEVVRRASETDATVVNLLKSFYKNNVGAMIALNALETAGRFFGRQVPAQSLAEFYRDIRYTIKNTNVFSDITTEGYLIRFNLNKDWFPYEDGTIESTLVEGAVSKLLFNSTGILLTNLRMFLPCIQDDELHKSILQRLKTGIVRLNASTVYAYMLCQSHDILQRLGMTQGFKQIILDATATG